MKTVCLILLYVFAVQVSSADLRLKPSHFAALEKVKFHNYVPKTVQKQPIISANYFNTLATKRPKILTKNTGPLSNFIRTYLTTKHGHQFTKGIATELAPLQTQSKLSDLPRIIKAFHNDRKKSHQRNFLDFDDIDYPEWIPGQSKSAMMEKQALRKHYGNRNTQDSGQQDSQKRATIFIPGVGLQQYIDPLEEVYDQRSPEFKKPPRWG